MTIASLDETLEQLRTKAAHDTDLAEALGFLAGDEEDEDPFAPVREEVASGVQLINARRLRQRDDDLRDRSLTTAEVVSFIRSISDRRGVDRRRQRGRLLGINVSRSVLHPAWQLDRSRADTWPGLDRVLAALTDVAPEARAADALMVAPCTELGGRSFADVLADGDVDLAVRLIRMAGDQS